MTTYTAGRALFIDWAGRRGYGAPPGLYWGPRRGHYPWWRGPCGGVVGGGVVIVSPPPPVQIVTVPVPAPVEPAAVSAPAGSDASPKWLQVMDVVANAIDRLFGPDSEEPEGGDKSDKSDHPVEKRRSEPEKADARPAPVVTTTPEAHRIVKAGLENAIDAYRALDAKIAAIMKDLDKGAEEDGKKINAAVDRAKTKIAAMEIVGTPEAKAKIPGIAQGAIDEIDNIIKGQSDRYVGGARKIDELNPEAVGKSAPAPATPAGSENAHKGPGNKPTAITGVRYPIDFTGGVDFGSGFGQRRLRGKLEFHKGQDFKVPKGRAILAAADGVVRFAGKMSGFGNAIIIDHTYPDGRRFSTLYGHMEDDAVFEKIHPKQVVKAGQRIASVGAGGNSTGYHLHFEVWEGGWKPDGGHAVDPMKWLTEHIPQNRPPTTGKAGAAAKSTVGNTN